MMALVPFQFQIHLWNWRIAKRFGTACSRDGSGNGRLRTETLENFSKFRKKSVILAPLKPPLRGGYITHLWCTLHDRWTTTLFQASELFGKTPEQHFREPVPLIFIPNFIMQYHYTQQCCAVEHRTKVICEANSKTPKLL